MRNCCLPSLRCRQTFTKCRQLLRYLALVRVVLARSIVATDVFPKAANEYEVEPCLEQVSAALPLPCLPVTEIYDPLPHSSYPECILSRKQMLCDIHKTTSSRMRSIKLTSLAVCLFITSTTAELSERNKIRRFAKVEPQQWTAKIMGNSSLTEIWTADQLPVNYLVTTRFQKQRQTRNR